MAPPRVQAPRAEAPRPRIIDHAVLEDGALLFEQIKRNAALREAAGLTGAEVDPQKLPKVEEWLRKQAASPKEIKNELGQQKLVHPQSAKELAAAQEAARQAKAAGKKRLPAQPEAEVAVTSPRAVAAVVEQIYKSSSPLLRGWLRKLGLTVEDGTWLMWKILDYSSPRNVASFFRRVASRGGALWELLMAFYPRVVAAERSMALELALEWIRSEPQRFGLTPELVEQLSRELTERLSAAEGTTVQYGTGIFRPAEVPGIGEVEQLATNLWLMRLSEVRDSAGRLMMDHARALVSFSKDGIDIVPVGIGESKFGSKAAEVFEQLVRNVGRAADTLRAANLPDLSTVPIRVRWGKGLVVIAQTEARGGIRAPQGLEASLRKATGRGDLKIEFVTGGTLEDAKASRKAVTAFMRLLLAKKK
jgi:hypothetical protein